MAPATGGAVIRRSTNTWLVVVVTLLLAAPLGFMLWHKGAPISWNLFGRVNQQGGIAIGGFDPLEYVASSRALPGDPAITTRWAGVEWRFVSANNRDRFNADPKRHAPRFGGYCATAISAGLTFNSDPAVFHVHDDAFYLFFNADARDDFVAKLGDGIIDRAETHWKSQ